jgi:hypothetical protein
VLPCQEVEAEAELKVKPRAGLTMAGSMVANHRVEAIGTLGPRKLVVQTLRRLDQRKDEEEVADQVPYPTLEMANNGGKAK